MSTSPSSRRDILWRITAGVGTLSVGALAYWGGQPIYEHLRKSSNWFRDDNPDHISRWRRLFGHYPAQQGTKIEALAGISHRNIAENRQFQSSSSKLVADAYSLGFPDPLVYRNPRTRMPVDPNSTLLCVGSRKSNAIVREYLGNPVAVELAQATLLPSIPAGWTGEARWSLVRIQPDLGPAYIQNGRLWLADGNTAILDHHTKRLYRSDERELLRPNGKYNSVPVTMGGHQIMVHGKDYLLVHVLPRATSRQPGRVVLIEGLHRPGTLAARRLFNAPPLELLQSIAERIGGSLYYQALFLVRCSHTALGEMSDQSLELIDAHPVLIEG